MSQGKGRKHDSAIRRTEIPDMNEEPPLIPDKEDSEDEHQAETSNSITHSMNVNHFLSLSRENKRARLEPEPELNSRWIKRLKTNIPDSTKTEEGQNGNNKLFLEILKSGNNNLQPRNQEHVPSEIKNPNHGEDITLLHPWIQRWCKKKTTSTDQEEVRFEPEREKEFEKRHYPSIAAMALMGKAMSGLNPYGLKKTESLMVWNAHDLR